MHKPLVPSPVATCIDFTSSALPQFEIVTHESLAAALSSQAQPETHKRKQDTEREQRQERIYSRSTLRAQVAHPASDHGPEEKHEYAGDSASKSSFIHGPLALRFLLGGDP